MRRVSLEFDLPPRRLLRLPQRHPWARVSQRAQIITDQSSLKDFNKRDEFPGPLIAMSFDIRPRSMQRTLTGAEDNPRSLAHKDKIYTTSRFESFVSNPLSRRTFEQ